MRVLSPVNYPYIAITKQLFAPSSKCTEKQLQQSQNHHVECDNLMSQYKAVRITEARKPTCLMFRALSFDEDCLFTKIETVTLVFSECQVNLTAINQIENRSHLRHDGFRAPYSSAFVHYSRFLLDTVLSIEWVSTDWLSESLYYTRIYWLARPPGL